MYCASRETLNSIRKFRRQKRWEQDGQDRPFEDAELDKLLRLVSHEAKHQLII